MPSCRHGYFHVVNNDYTHWEMYAISESASPAINSQGNRYLALANPFAKEVTKRVDTAAGKWHGWNWRSEGNLLLNGAYFTPSAAVMTSSGAQKKFIWEVGTTRHHAAIVKKMGHAVNTCTALHFAVVFHVSVPAVVSLLMELLLSLQETSAAYQKSADKLSSMIWEEKHEYDGPRQNLNADNAYHIGAFLDVPIGHELNSTAVPISPVAFITSNPHRRPLHVQ
ncbi:probable pectate lyase 8 [Tanacetum coccineum]